MSCKVGMVSLGCPKNQMDAELMLAKLAKAGYEITDQSGLADVVIVNTCGFIEDAKKEAIENILEFAQLKKEKQIRGIVVTGCLAQRYQEELATELPECDCVLGLGANGDIVEAVEKANKGEKLCRFPDLSCWPLEGDRVLTTPSFFAYLRIADGCDNRCAYCAIPLIRGNLRSRPMDALVSEAKALAAGGAKELVLVAQDTTVYGRDRDDGASLPKLLDRLCEIDGIRWIRLLYCYPDHITDELLDTIARQEKVVRYLDVPIQHASGKILKAMNRFGDKDTLKALFARIREKMPDMVLRTTVMTGFPGETEADFEELCELTEAVKFERLGCFTFSPEEGTPAAQMPDQVPEEDKARRRDILMEQQAVVAQRYNDTLVGTVREVLVESFDRYGECWFGRSAADAPDIDGKVFIQCPKGKTLSPGAMVQVKITDTLDWDLIGELVE
ncbi:MAG: 30S ribosomal protein S12 methylthiotransferase RimO [Clostridia bacterium]|nr:30S ribosomal protein S12 methylthiotransferase RimO [Clostridia bacterium]MBQ7302591.1 30S ribosomal protein S12 methylthiotransferase RimO [Clostridia bacterium]